QLMGEGSDCFIVIKTEAGSQRLRITGTRLHPDGDLESATGEEGLPLVMPHDASLLITELDGPDWFELASEADLEGLAASDPVGTMAFTRTTSLESPRARTAFGRIVQLSDPRLEPIDSGDPVVIRHTLFVVPDMSGGPIFKPDGKVVGILTIPMVSETDPNAAGSASGKYGLRIDVLRSVWADYPRD
ncbi:serine protease, partial [Opitutaceae bacterium]|nr:serine protease [Opitutaceae bacterium]